MRKAVIDVGSNSIKLYVAELGQERAFESVLDRSHIGSLGEGLKKRGSLSRAAMLRNCRLICEHAGLARSLGCREVTAVGTMALRVADNGIDFVHLVQKACGVHIQVISAHEEARLAYLAVLRGFPPAGRRAVFDTGGGSTEFILDAGGQVERKFTTALGALSITEYYLKSDPVTPQELRTAGESIETALKGLRAAPAADLLIGMGGTLTSMGAVKHKLDEYDPKVVHGSSLTLAEVEGQIALYGSKTVAERRQMIRGLASKRAPVILAGALIVRGIMQELETPVVHISDRGLRHGVMEELFACRSFPGN